MPTIVFASPKGGVGKSTVASNLAVALQSLGSAVGLCDCDLYGPSIGLMFSVNDRPMATEQNVIIPITRYGVKLMSMGFLLEDDSPAILRGPMVTRYTQQFLRQAAQLTARIVQQFAVRSVVSRQQYSITFGRDGQRRV